MEELTNWSEILMSTLKTATQNIANALPSIFGAFIIILFGWLLARLAAFLVNRLLRVVKIDELGKRFHVDQLLQKASIKKSVSQIISKFVYWLVILLVVITASETLGWDVLSGEVSKLVNWLPSLFTSIVFFVIGIYLANFVKDIIRGATLSLGIQGGSILSSIVFYLLVIMISLSALNQAGVDTQILSSNLLLIIAGILLASAISYGLASKDILANLLASLYGKRTLKKGQVIQYDDLTGTIVDISSINIILITEDKLKVVIPSSELINNRFTILKEAPAVPD
ncbi:MAG: mechanosensitive ion channel [Saprospiraceae bacterium]|nr:mechanosensitive ion channel [Saprospiraceae bacterium]